MEQVIEAVIWLQWYNCLMMDMKLTISTAFLSETLNKNDFTLWLHSFKFVDHIKSYQKFPILLSACLSVCHSFFSVVSSAPN